MSFVRSHAPFRSWCVCLLLRLQFDHSSVIVWNLLQIREVLVILVEGKHGIQYRPNQVSPLRRSEANKPNRARPRNLHYQVTVRAIREKSSCTLITMRSPSMSTVNMFNDRNKQQSVQILKLIICIQNVFTNLYIDFSSDRHELHTRIIDS